jgi:hypothetical protein
MSGFLAVSVSSRLEPRNVYVDSRTARRYRGRGGRYEMYEDAFFARTDEREFD